MTQGPYGGFGPKEVADILSMGENVCNETSHSDTGSKTVSAILVDVTDRFSWKNTNCHAGQFRRNLVAIPCSGDRTSDPNWTLGLRGQSKNIVLSLSCAFVRPSAHTAVVGTQHMSEGRMVSCTALIMNPTGFSAVLKFAATVALYEPPSKSIVDARYENIGYRFWGRAYRFTSLLFKSTLNNAKMQRNWFHGFRSLTCWEWFKGPITLDNKRYGNCDVDFPAVHFH